jgi:type VI secretion system secreted protein VgrG
MSSKYTQDNRVGQLTTTLGKDKLLLTRLDVFEGLSELFDVGVRCLSEDADIDLGSLLGKPAAVRLRTVGKNTRYFSGVVVEANYAGEEQGLFAYKVVMRPWLWLLGYTQDSRIFQNLNVIDIIKKVFDEAGCPDYKFECSETYKKIDYCVQYKESHLNFVLRLMEEFGIYYYFEHTADKHVMKIVDSKSAHKPPPSLPKLKFIGMGARTRDDEEYLRDWKMERRFQSGKVTVNAFDFDKPTAQMITDQSSPGGYAKDNLEIYNYPHKYKKGDESDLGLKFARAMLQSGQALDKRRYTAGDAPSLFPGALAVVFGHKVASENGSFLVVEATHTFVGEAFSTGVGGYSGGNSGNSYHGSFVLQPKDHPYRAPMLTPRPIIYGPLTAIVVGPAGEEIHTDKHGRIKVQYNWDRLGKKDDKSSRWMRVSQIWSGKAWGGIHIPRIGMEVVVEHIDGDPDRPLVVGTLYNGDNPPPYALPDNKTQSGVKSRSSKGGGESHYNELMFEDKKGSELVRFHAEKDLNSTIENIEYRTVIGKGQKGPGEMSRQTRIETGDDSFTVANGDNNVIVSRHRSEIVGVNEMITIGSDRSERVGNNETIMIGGSQVVTVAKNQTVVVGEKITIKAGKKITLKVGGSSIVMDGKSIKIKTIKLSENSDKHEITATANLKQKSGKIELN